MRRQKQTYHTPGKPTVTELREDFRHTPIVKLARLALWNLFSRGIVDARSPTLGVIKKSVPEIWEDVINSPRPVFGL